MTKEVKKSKAGNMNNGKLRNCHGALIHSASVVLLPVFDLWV